MKIKSHMFSQASGSVAGSTFSHNAGGMYVRARSIPTNPQTSFQQEIRSALGNNATSWAALSEPQRESWRQYALNVPMVDKLGDARAISGLAMFNRSNTPRIQAGLPVIQDAPVIFNLGDTPLITNFIVNSDGTDTNITLSVNEGNADYSGNILVFFSRPISPTIVYFKGPFRFAGQQAFTNLTARPVAVTTPYNQGVAPEDTQLAVKIRVTLADGRLTQEAIARTVVTESA